MTGRQPGEMRIGDVLKQARARAGLEVRSVEEQTKIRVKYLRALEDEQWDALPSPAYAKGFLRTYAQLLGLDGEALADAFRRQVEGGRNEASYPLGEQVLERRRPLADRPARPRWLLPLVVLAVAVAGVLLAIGLLGDDAGESPARDAGGHGAGQGRRQAAGDRPAAGTVAISLAIRKPVQVCLIGGGGQALIDGQLLNPGDQESFERKRFELRFPAGFDSSQFTLEIAGKPRSLPKAQGPAAYEIIAPQRVVATRAPGKECP